MDFISQLEAAFKQNKNEENAFQMKRYMKNLFSFYGIKTNELISDPKQIKNTKILKHEEKFYFYFLS